MNGLYRDTNKAWLTGVCAGVAARFGLEIWVVRILVVSAGLLGGGLLVVLAYFAASLMLEKQTPQIFQTKQQQFDHQMKQKVGSRVALQKSCLVWSMRILKRWNTRFAIWRHMSPPKPTKPIKHFAICNRKFFLHGAHSLSAFFMLFER